MIVNFLTVFKNYVIEVLPFLAIGFFLSGLIHEFMPAKLVERHLGGKGIKPLLYATFAGTLLPICCIGSLPVAVSFHQKGAKLGAVLAFLVATPATSISALLVCYALLGIKFTIFIFFAVIPMGLIMGTVGNLIKFKPKGVTASLCSHNRALATDPICGMNVDRCNGLKTEYRGVNYYFCSTHCQQTFKDAPEKYIPDAEHIKGITERMSSVLKYAFVDMVKEIGPEMLLGLVLAALVATIAPIGRFIGNHFGGGFGYLFSLIFGLVMYICSTASVPLVHAFVSQGMNIGAGMVLLIVGPVTSLGTILVIRKEYGIKILLAYLGVIISLSLILGYLFTFF